MLKVRATQKQIGQSLVALLWVFLCLPVFSMGQTVEGLGTDIPRLGADVEAASNHEPIERTFLIFDGLRMRDKPNLSVFGLKQITVLYHKDFWPDGQPDDEPNEARLRLLTDRAWKLGHLVCLDIEHWPVYEVSATQKQQSLAKLMRVADEMHARKPGLRIGYYGLLPRQDYWAPVGDDAKRLEAWQAHNQGMQALAGHVDVVFPSVYTFYDDPQGWVRFAEATIAEARPYGKQVYVFLCPWYHNSNEALKGQPIDADFWRLQLETAHRLADGVVIWSDPWKHWSEQAPWWIQTRAFMDRLGETGE